MNLIVPGKSLQIQVNRFKKGKERKPENGTPISFILRCLDKIRLNSSIMDQILSKAGNFFGCIWQSVVKWNLGCIFWMIFHPNIQVAIRPLMLVLMRNLGILLRRVEKKLVALQEYFFGKMEYLINHEEPGNYFIKMQCNHGQQVDYQYEIAWVERTFDIIQLVNYVMLNINHKILATFEKAQLKFRKFQNRHHAAQVISMPEFEITNPEIFDCKPSEGLTSEIKSWANQANLPIQNMFKTTLQQNIKFFLFLENRFSPKKSRINIHQQLCDNRLVNKSVNQTHSIFQNIRNQLLNPEIFCKIKQHLQVFKIIFFSMIHHLKFNRQL